MEGFRVKQTFIWFLGLGVVLLGVGPALVQGASPGKEIQKTLGIILDRLDDLQGDVDALQGALGPCEVPPVWGKKYSGADRFVSVLDGAAYCDKETGLVWEGSPEAGTHANWQAAISHCATLELDGRKGWSLPTREQLATLVDSSNSDPPLPTDHPFQNVQINNYWSATTVADTPDVAWAVGFGLGLMNVSSKVNPGDNAWCVRGGQSFDGNTHDSLH